MFGYVVNFTGRLIWLNIFFLLTVALMPFSTGFYSEYVLSKTITPVIFYSKYFPWEHQELQYVEVYQQP